MLKKAFIATCTCLCLCSITTLAKGHYRSGRRRSAKGNVAVFKYPLVAETRLHLKRVKVRFNVRATVPPAQIKSTLATLKSMHINDTKTLEINRFNQNKTSTGLINIQATLSGVLKVSNLQAAYDLAKRYNRSGLVTRVANVQPFFPIRMRQKTKENLSLKMYAMAQQFAGKLSNQSGQPFKVAMINFNPKGARYTQPENIGQNRQFAMMANKVSDAQAALPLLKVVQLKAMVVLKAKQKRPRGDNQPVSLQSAPTSGYSHQPAPHQLSNHPNRPVRKRRPPRHRYPQQMH